MTRRVRFAGVLGWPLRSTLSPVIHNAAFKYLGMNWRYLAFPVEPSDLRDAVVGLKALGAAGANVTIPHKESVVEHLDELEGVAAELDAVNTIEIRDGALIGHNTDVSGFIGFLKGDAGIDPAGRSVLVLGAGGAARAIVKGLGDEGAASIVIAARDEAKASALTRLATGASSAPFSASEDLAGGVDLIVNCTPLGMDGEDLLAGAALHEGQAVIDLIYEPPRTPLLEHARSRGADAWGGLGMLVHQAADAFRIWTGQEPPLEIMSAAAVHALGGGALGREV